MSLNDRLKALRSPGLAELPLETIEPETSLLAAEPSGGPDATPSESGHGNGAEIVRELPNASIRITASSAS